MAAAVEIKSDLSRDRHPPQLPVAAVARQTSNAGFYIHKLTILQKRQTSPGLSLFAGGVAGGVEAATTVSLLDLGKYPLPTKR